MVLSIKTTDRLKIYPWMIPGSKLPTPSGPLVPPTPHEVAMALAGITQI